MKITVQIDGEPKECVLLLDALDKIDEEAQKRQLKMSTVTTPCEVDTVPTNDLVYRPNNPYPYRMTREEAIFYLRELPKVYATNDTQVKSAIDMAIEALSTDAVQGWIPLLYDDNGLGTNFPYECDGEWVIVTDGKTISVERIKKDAYDHFFPNGRWFELENVIAWMPLPKPYKGGGTE